MPATIRYCGNTVIAGMARSCPGDLIGQMHRTSQTFRKACMVMRNALSRIKPPASDWV